MSGLSEDAFTVLEDGRPQRLQFFSAADTPATIGLLVDNSTSMMNKRELVIAAAVGFTKVSNPEDEVFVLAFNENVSQVWAPRVIKESNLISMRAVLLGNIAARGKTALYDAIAEGFVRLEKGRHTRQVLVIVSDGGDNASATALEDVVARTRSGEAAIFSVALRDAVDREGNPKFLKRLATDTGGESFEPDDLEDVPRTLEHIARDIRSAYTIGYEPQKSDGGRALRKLKVTVRTKDGKTLNARTRGGYMARPRT